MPLLTAAKNKKFDYRCTVRLLDDSEILQCEFEGKETGQYLIDQVCAHLDLIEKEYFSLSFEDSNKTKQWLDPNKRILKQVKGMSPMVFCFRVKFYPGWPERLQEELTRYHVYLQLKRDLQTGRLSCSDDEAAHLAALVLQVEIGDYDPEEQPGRYVSDYSLVARASSRLEDQIMHVHCCETRGLNPAQAELAFIRRATQMDLYGIRPQPFKDQRGNQVSLGLNYRGVSVIQDGKRSHLYRWQDIQKLNFENKMFIVHLVYLEDSRTKNKRTVGYKSDSVQKCKQFWRDATEHRLFFTCESSRAAPRMVFGGSLFSRHSRVRFSGRTEREVTRQPTRREQPQFNRYGLRPSLQRKAQSVPATPCESQESASACGVGRVLLDSPIPEHNSLADDEAMLMTTAEDASVTLEPLSEINDFTPSSSPDASPIKRYDGVGGVLGVMADTLDAGQDGDPLPDTAGSGYGSDSHAHTTVSGSRLERGAPPTPPLVAPGRPSLAPPRRSPRRLLLLPLLRVLLYALLTVAALVLLLLICVFELDTATTRELRTFPELQHLRRELYEPAKQYIL